MTASGGAESGAGAPDGPVALVTGARKGIGRHLAEHLLRRGYRVVGCSRTAPESPPGPAGVYQHVELDVADEAAVKRLMSTLRRSYGRLDVLINNAGVASMNHALLVPLESVRRLFETNVVGTFLFCREAAKLMKRRRFGRIVNMATVAVPLKLAGEAVYAASKAAVVNLTEILAREFADFGITVNALGPTPIRTDLLRGVGDEKLETLVGRQAIRRMGEMRDVDNVVDFFVDERSDFVTGQVIYLGGV